MSEMAAKQRELDVKLINSLERKLNMSENSSEKLKQCTESNEVESLIPLFSRKKKDGGYECEICYVSFTAIRAFKRHFARFHDLKYPCNECGTKFSDTHLLRYHITSAHNEKMKNYKIRCPVCNQNVHMEAPFRSHMCHLHSEWTKTNLDKFILESHAVEPEISSATQNQGTIRWKRQMTIRFVKHIIKTSNTDNETAFADETNRLGKNNYQYSSPNGDESDSNDDIWKKKTKQVLKEGSSAASKVYRDAESLRVRYSCKDCYVPLSRINLGKNTSVKLVTLEKQRQRSPQKKSTYQENHYESREKLGSAKQMQRKCSEQEEEHQNQFTSLGIEVRLDKLRNSNVFIESEYDDFENFDPSIPVTQALEECVDPLSFGEPPIETTNEFEQYPVPFEFPVKIETPDPNTEDPEQCNEQSVSPSVYERALSPFKVESMDCEDSPERIEMTAEHPDPQDIPGKTESVEYYYGEPSGAFTAYAECIDTFEPVKVEIEEHPIPEYTECTAEGAAESSEISDTNSYPIETSTLSTPGLQKTQLEESCTMVASKICNKLFTTRRTMLRHFRKRHLSCFDDTVYCVCGKEMIGRRAMEKHFSRQCDRLVKTTRSTSDQQKMCKPLEKKYKCAKCGERFWLLSCLNDHPPNCELPKPNPVNPCRLIKNINRAYGLTNYLGEVGEYICRICGAKFMSIDTLMQHLRTFSSKKKWECVDCRTVFPGQRLLKGHVQSTHELNSTTIYTHFCDICHQGFTKRINQRIHTMHVHANEMVNRGVEASTNYESSADRVIPIAPDPTENQCNVCNLVFVNQKRFMDHISYYNRNDQFRCNICGQEFEGQYKAHHHRKKVHYEGKMKTTYTHFCDICKEGFMYKTHLHAHMFHVHDDEFNCVTSVKDYNVPEENESAKDLFPCTKCTKKFQTVTLLLTHIDLYHGNDATPISKVNCSHCDKVFSTLGACILHVKSCHTTVPGALSNSNNPQGVQPTPTSSTSANLTDTDISIISEKIGSSDDTNTVLPQRTETDEVNIQGPSDGNIDPDNCSTDANTIRPTVCTTCGFDCPGPWGLARHKALYLNSGIYVCEFCGRRFSWQSFYRDHKLKHFRRDVHNNFFCPVCDEGFDAIECLQMHALHLHQEPLNALRDGSSPNTPGSALSRAKATDLNAIGNPQQPLTDAQSNDCEQTYGTVKQFQDNATSRSKDSRVVVSDTPGNSSNSANLYPMCDVCNMIFITEAMLKFHKENTHMGAKEKASTTVEPDPQTRQGNINDRFYVLLGEKVHAKVVDIIGKKITECNKNINLTTNLYRYDVPLACDHCNLTFHSKDMLLSHREFVHKIQKNFVFKTTSVDEKKSSQKNVAENPKSKTKVQVDDPHQVKCRSNDSIPLSQSTSKILRNVDECSTKIGGHTSAGNIPTASPVTYQKKVNYYECRLCDIIFIDKNLMAVHEENVHGLKTSESFNEVSLQPLSTVTKTVQPVCVDNLWIGSKKEIPPTMPPLAPFLQPDTIHKFPTRTISPIEIVISDDETEDVTELSSTTMNSLISEYKKSTSPPPLRLINLPPGNYKISKLKVRSTDTAVGKLARSAKCVEPPFKNSKP